MSNLANLATPHVKGWWATTSTRRRMRRISEIQSKLNQHQSYGHEWEIDELISALRFLGAAAAWFVVFSLSTFFVLLSFTIP